MERVIGIALWRQIEKQLGDEIRRGVFKPGDKLPTEIELAGRFGVNRHTLRRAVGALQDAGLVRVEQGRGTFVQEDVIAYQVGKRTRFSENIVTLDRQPGGRLLRATEMSPGRDVEKHLELRKSARVLMIENLRIADGIPIGVSTHYFPKNRCAGILEAFQDTGSITKALFRIGIKDYLREVTRVMPRMPSAEDARLLQQSRSQPILVSESVNVDPEGRPIEYVVARFAGHRVQLVFEP